MKKEQLILGLLSVSAYLLLYAALPQFNAEVCSCLKYALCWVGILELVVIIFSWKKITGSALSLYTIFMLFFMLFNFGQCFLWAIGIHGKNEIGSMALYYRLAVPDDCSIAQTQLIVLVSASMIHTAVMLMRPEKTKSPATKPEQKSEQVPNRFLLEFCLILCPFVSFAEFYYQGTNYLNAQAFGYTALYYDQNVQSVNVVFQILARLFFPCIIGMLIGSEYKKKSIMCLAYSLFAVDVLMSLMVGDRGGWIYSLLILVISHNLFCKKFKAKNYLIAGAAGYFLMIVMIAVKRLRNSGVSLDGIIDQFGSIVAAPFTEALTEMGGTMGVTLAFVMESWDIFPYGNSFLWGLVTAPSKRIITILGLEYENIGSWFSQTYLHISNGAGFSIVAETLANFGPLLLPLVMFGFGCLLAKITDIDRFDLESSGISIFYRIIIVNVIINISRNAFNYNMGEVLYTVVLFYVVFSVFLLIRKQCYSVDCNDKLNGASCYEKKKFLRYRS